MALRSPSKEGIAKADAEALKKLSKTLAPRSKSSNFRFLVQGLMPFGIGPLCRFSCLLHPSPQTTKKRSMNVKAQSARFLESSLVRNAVFCLLTSDFLTRSIMAYSYTEKKRIRKSFAKRAAVTNVPYLLATQLESYASFLQAETPPAGRANQGPSGCLQFHFPDYQPQRQRPAGVRAI